jgi:hypothetical protein
MLRPVAASLFSLTINEELTDNPNVLRSTPSDSQQAHTLGPQILSASVARADPLWLAVSVEMPCLEAQQSLPPPRESHERLEPSIRGKSL